MSLKGSTCSDDWKHFRSLLRREQSAKTESWKFGFSFSQLQHLQVQYQWKTSRNLKVTWTICFRTSPMASPPTNSFDFFMTSWIEKWAWFSSVKDFFFINLINFIARERYRRSNRLQSWLSWSLWHMQTQDIRWKKAFSKSRASLLLGIKSKIIEIL